MQTSLHGRATRSAKCRIQTKRGFWGVNDRARQSERSAACSAERGMRRLGKERVLTAELGTLIFQKGGCVTRLQLENLDSNILFTVGVRLVRGAAVLKPTAYVRLWACTRFRVPSFGHHTVGATTAYWPVSAWTSRGGMKRDREILRDGCTIGATVTVTHAKENLT